MPITLNDRNHDESLSVLSAEDMQAKTPMEVVTAWLENVDAVPGAVEVLMGDTDTWESVIDDIDIDGTSWLVDDTDGPVLWIEVW